MVFTKQSKNINTSQSHRLKKNRDQEEKKCHDGTGKIQATIMQEKIFHTSYFFMF